MVCMVPWRMGGPKRPPQRRKKAGSRKDVGVADGIRTRDNQNHNLGLYQLSYDHQPGEENLVFRLLRVKPRRRAI